MLSRAHIARFAPSEAQGLRLTWKMGLPSMKTKVFLLKSSGRWPRLNSKESSFSRPAQPGRCRTIWFARGAFIALFPPCTEVTGTCHRNNMFSRFKFACIEKARWILHVLFRFVSDAQRIHPSPTYERFTSKNELQCHYNLSCFLRSSVRGAKRRHDTGSRLAKLSVECRSCHISCVYLQVEV
jgi:hypothetical protein